MYWQRAASPTRPQSASPSLGQPQGKKMRGKEELTFFRDFDAKQINSYLNQKPRNLPGIVEFSTPSSEHVHWSLNPFQSMGPVARNQNLQLIDPDTKVPIVERLIRNDWARESANENRSPSPSPSPAPPAKFSVINVEDLRQQQQQLPPHIAAELARQSRSFLALEGTSNPKTPALRTKEFQEIDVAHAQPLVKSLLGGEWFRRDLSKPVKLKKNARRFLATDFIEVNRKLIASRSKSVAAMRSESVEGHFQQAPSRLNRPQTAYASPSRSSVAPSSLLGGGGDARQQIRPANIPSLNTSFAATSSLRAASPPPNLFTQKGEQKLNEWKSGADELSKERLNAVMKAISSDYHTRQVHSPQLAGKIRPSSASEIKKLHQQHQQQQQQSSYDPIANEEQLRALMNLPAEYQKKAENSTMRTVNMQEDARRRHFDTMTPEELRQRIRNKVAQFGKGHSPLNSQEIFRKFDFQHKGSLSFHDFGLAMERHNLCARDSPVVYHLFRLWDSKKQGTVTLEDFIRDVQEGVGETDVFAFKPVGNNNSGNVKGASSVASTPVHSNNGNNNNSNNNAASTMMKSNKYRLPPKK